MHAIFAKRHIGKYTQTYIDCALYFFEPPGKNKKKRTYVCMYACMYVCNAMQRNAMQRNAMQCNVMYVSTYSM